MRDNLWQASGRGHPCPSRCHTCSNRWRDPRRPSRCLCTSPGHGTQGIRDRKGIGKVRIYRKLLVSQSEWGYKERYKSVSLCVGQCFGKCRRHYLSITVKNSYHRKQWQCWFCFQRRKIEEKESAGEARIMEIEEIEEHINVPDVPVIIFIVMHE